MFSLGIVPLIFFTSISRGDALPILQGRSHHNALGVQGHNLRNPLGVYLAVNMYFATEREDEAMEGLRAWVHDYKRFCADMPHTGVHKFIKTNMEI